MGYSLGASGNFDGFSAGPQGTLPDPARLPHRRSVWLWTLLVLAVGVALAVLVASRQRDRAREDALAAMHATAERSYAALDAQLRACGMLVRTVQTVFLTSVEVTQAEFADVYANLRPREQFPSLIALAYAERRRVGPQDRFVTSMVAPQRGNERVLGLDVGQQPANLDAVLRSRDSDEPSLSAPFELVQPVDAAGSRPDGVTLRLPVYAPGPPPAALPDRRERMRGSIAVSFRVGTLIARALPEDVLDTMHVRVSDVTEGGGELALPLFDSQPQRHFHADGLNRFDRDLAYGGRVWRIEMHPMGDRAAATLWQQSLLWPGLLASVLLALLVLSVASTRRRALELGWRMSHRYRESEERFRALNELLPALVLLAHGDDHRIRYANQASRLRLGEDVYDADLPALFDDQDLRERLRAPEPPTFSSAEAVLRSVAGDHFWASVSIAPVEVGGESSLLMVATDISEQRQLTELLTYQASHDALTELFNRREFERRVERALEGVARGGAAAALLFIDLDQFKLINDTSGHMAGDQLLSQLAVMMREQLRAGDVLARLGGDEFGVLSAGVRDAGDARLVAERLRERIDGYVFVWQQRTYTVSASIGVVMIDRAALDLRDLFAQADTACYMAKESGRNRVHFYSEQDDDIARRRSEMEWVSRLRWAIDEQRLRLEYQEVWPLGGRTPRGPHIELLLRLRDEHGQRVLPGAFVPAAERYGLMPQIDRWVIETALAHFNELHPSGEALQLATINLSGVSIEDESLVDLILERIQHYRIAPERVCFEITETAAVRNLAQVGRFIQRLREVGCRIALDDFGAGMSSFGYLKNLPVDIIKIDGSFIRDLLVDPMSHSIVRAVTDIGHQRGLTVVAEWVTSTEISDALRGLGVDFAQGYALHVPEPVVFQRVERGLGG